MNWWTVQNHTKALTHQVVGITSLQVLPLSWKVLAFLLLIPGSLNPWKFLVLFTPFNAPCPQEDIFLSLCSFDCIAFVRQLKSLFTFKLNSHQVYPKRILRLLNYRQDLIVLFWANILFLFFIKSSSIVWGCLVFIIHSPLSDNFNNFTGHKYII